MTKELDVELKRAAMESRTEVPDVVRRRIEETLAGLSVKAQENMLGASEGKSQGVSRVRSWVQGARKRAVVTAAVAASVVCVVGVGVMSPEMAQALRQSPILGSVFGMLGDEGLRKARQTGMVTEVDQGVTDEGIMVKVTEALYDGARISIGYVLESSGELAGHPSPHIDFKVDGERLGNYGAGGHGDFVDAQTYVGLVHVDPGEELPETFELEMTVRQLGDTKGKWKFAFPVSKNTSGSKTVMPMKIKTFEEATLVVERVTFAVSSTEVVGQIKGLGEEDGSVQFEIIDENGLKLHEMAGSRKESFFQVLFPPMQEIPKSITIRPIQHDHADLSPDVVKGLELNIPIK